MKKFLIPVLTILGIFLVTAVFAIYLNYSKVQYDKDLLFHNLRLQDGGELICEYNGMTTRILGGNVSRISKVVNVYEKRRLFKEPEYNKDEAIYLTFSDGAEYIIAVDESMDDAVFVIYKYKNKEQYYSIQGYHSFDWAQRAVSPEGTSNPNEVVE
ncbi:MAG: hypothetical protein JXN65_01625 [Clostridia bacterium]|nr:hypothetical protein [Clostridia bacterium]